MGDQIYFPYNYESYVNKGMAALQVGNSSLAAEYFEKALSIRYNDDILLFYLMILPESGRGEAAIEFLEGKAPKLWESRTLHDVDRLFLELLLEKGDLEEAQVQLELRQNHLPNHSQTELLESLADKLQQRKEWHYSEKKQLRKKLLEEKQEILGGKFLAVNAFLMHCKQLANQDYAFICIPLLADERVHPLHKTEILQDLKERALSEECTVTKGSFSQRLSPTSLLSVLDTPFYQTGEQLLASREDFQEEVKTAIARNLFLHTAYYYPFAEEALLSADQWLEGMVYLQKEAKQQEAPSQNILDRINEVESAMNELAGL